MRRDIIFEVIIASEIYNRFDTSHKFWDKFGVRKPFLHKCLGYFSIESTVNPCYLTIDHNPKEYFEMFEKRKINKKHRGVFGDELWKKGVLRDELWKLRKQDSFANKF